MRWPLVVIGFWIALAAVLSLALPPLAVVAAQRQSAVLPDNAPVMVTSREMAEAFHDKGSDSMLLVVLTDEKGLGPADEDTYRTLVDKLRQDTRRRHRGAGLPQHPRTCARSCRARTTRPGTCRSASIGDMGSPAGRSAYKHVADLVKQTVAGSTLTANLTGPAATVADMTEIGERDLHADRDRDRSHGAAHPADRLPKPGHHAGAVDHDRHIPGDCAGRFGWACRTGLGRYPARRSSS